MTIKKLEKAAAILKAVQTLDLEIIEIEKLAMLVADSEVKCSIELNISDLGKKNEADSKVGFDEDGSLTCNSLYDQMRRQYTFAFGGAIWGSGCTPEKKSEHQHEIKKDISVNVTLQILGAMLYEKTAMREKLLATLQKIGVSI